MRLIVKNGLVVTEKEIIKSDILIVNEKIEKIAPDIEDGLEDQVIDASGKIIMPGVVDAHVHYYMKTENGRTIDDFLSGSTSAAFGGVTTVIDFAGPVKGKTLLESLIERDNEAFGNSYVDYSFHMEITGEYEQDFNELFDLKKHGISSIKIYTTYGMTRLPYEKIPYLLQKAKDAGMLLIVHAEDNDILERKRKELIEAGKTDISYYACSRPNNAEAAAIRKLIAMAKIENVPVYFVHVSTKEGLYEIKQAQKTGQAVYGETCPHYLLLTDDCYIKEDGQKYVMAPPLRKAEDQELLWEGIKDEILSCVVTDHCSFDIREKLASKNFLEIIPGIGGSETLLPLLYTEGVLKGKITLMQLVNLISKNPAKIFGLYPRKGSISLGSDADLVIFDPEKEVVLKGDKLHSKAEYTVFDGFKLKGYPEITILRGRVICKNGELADTNPNGKFIEAGGDSSILKPV